MKNGHSPTPDLTVHLIGIGGIGMSAVARMYLSMGYGVQGSDIKKNEILQDLERLGAKILIGHDAGHVNGANLVVYSSSIQENHPERVSAIQNHLKIIHRSQALAEICQNKFTIAVTGTHGKTTTTAMVGMVLKEAGRDPSIVVGGLVNFFGGNAYCGKGQEIVIEADESDSSFLNFSPKLEVITNIEEEHMDHFLTMNNIEADYRKFIDRLPADGEWIGCAEDTRICQIAEENSRKVILYGFDAAKARIYATDIQECPDGKRGIAFEAWDKEESLGKVHLKVLGRHNILNALAAVTVGVRLHIPFAAIRAGLEKFEGAGRRFDVQYEDKNYLIVDDYAHHPTEILKTLQAAKGLLRKRVVVLFQPHRYTRTKFLFDDFLKCFTAADKLLITDIYAAGEEPIQNISGPILCEAIRQSGHTDVSFVSRANASRALNALIEPGDVVLVLGAGDICQAAKEIADKLNTEIFKEIKGKVVTNELLSKHTSLKIGGPCRYWIEPEDAGDLKKILLLCRDNGLKKIVLGLGSNILAPDQGWQGVVIYLGAPYFRRMTFENGRLTARAGTPNTLFIQFAVEQGLGGCEFLLGIPGSIGGAIAMNAGSHNQSVDEILESVKLIDFDGNEIFLKKEEIEFSYRRSGIKNAVIIEGVFSLPKAERAVVQKKLDEYKDYRMNTQDLQHASAGCMFKNPALAGCSSGKLIDEAGLKGLTVGQAQVSAKHGNYIINLGGATSEDVKRLIEKVKHAVREKTGIDLESEVKVL